MIERVSTQSSLATNSSDRVLKNVYGLLSLSMIPTVVGAWLGMQTSLFAGMGAGLSAIIFMVFAFGMMFLINKNQNNAAGVPLLLFFTFGMGLFLSRLLQYALGHQAGPGIVMTSFIGTAAIFAAMNVLSTFVKRDVSTLQKGFVIAAIALLVVSLINLFFQSSMLMMIISFFVIIVFSGFLFFEMKDIREGRETNYIIATLGLYLSLYNVFTALINLLLGIDMSSKD